MLSQAIQDTIARLSKEEGVEVIYDGVQFIGDKMHVKLIVGGERKHYLASDILKEVENET